MSLQDDVDGWVEQLHLRKTPCEDTIEKICSIAKEILLLEDNIKQIHPPVTVCGDIHGQFPDMLEIFEIAGPVPETNYLFLGDYVDRGYDSIECIALLLCYKIKHPGKITLLRGNHDSRQITQVYGFFEECRRKYGGSTRVWKMVTDVFDYLPLSALIGDSIFCVHGGLSPDLQSLDLIHGLDRKNEVPHDGPICDLLWSDPDEKSGWNMSPRGAGYFFGPDSTEKFCHKNGLSLLARAHQLVMEGYSWSHNQQVVTIFSAPNYCYRCGNKAAVMEVGVELDSSFLQYDSSSEQSGVQITKRLPYHFL